MIILSSLNCARPWPAAGSVTCAVEASTTFWCMHNIACIGSRTDSWRLGRKMARLNLPVYFSYTRRLNTVYMLHIYICIYVCINVCWYVCMYVYILNIQCASVIWEYFIFRFCSQLPGAPFIYLYMFVYICIYTDTHKHTHTRANCPDFAVCIIWPGLNAWNFVVETAREFNFYLHIFLYEM